MKHQKLSDETIHPDDLRRIHDRVRHDGLAAAQNHLAERESALLAYVLCSAEQIGQQLRMSGAPPPLVGWVNHELIARMLVVIETQQLAHYTLWRDLMGDEPESEARNDSKGQADEEKP